MVHSLFIPWDITVTIAELVVILYRISTKNIDGPIFYEVKGATPTLFLVTGNLEVGYSNSHCTV